MRLMAMCSKFRVPDRKIEPSKVVKMHMYWQIQSTMATAKEIGVI